MRILFFAFLSLLILISCGSDDECTSETIVGTYAGTSECDESSDPDVEVNDGPTTLVVKNVGANNYTVESSDGLGYAFTVDGCNVTIPEVEIDFFGISIKISGDGSFDGDQLTLNIDNTINGDSVSCNVIATKV